MMIDYDFVIFLSKDWDDFFRRYLLQVLAEQSPMSKVLCVDRPVCLVTTPLRDPIRWIKQTAGRDRLCKLSKNLFVYRPWVFLHDHVAPKLPIIPLLNREWLRRQLKGVINSLGLHQDRLIVWIYDPFQEEYLGMLGERLSVYEAYDEYTAWKGVPFFRTKDDLMAREARILARADVVFVVSEALYQRKCHLSTNTHVVPNSADVHHFGRARDQAAKVADDIATIPHPIIGFVGNVTERVDFGLLAELAEAHREWSLVVVGEIADSLKSGPRRELILSLKRARNVYLLGGKPYEMLPNYLKAFDVCLIPYVPDDPFNANCSPLKLYEYMATGKPIVSTDLPAVRPFCEVVTIGRSHQEFGQQVVKALQEGTRFEQARLQVAQENSWDKRVKDMLGVINETIVRKVDADALCAEKMT